MIYVNETDIPITKYRIDFLKAFIIKQPPTYSDSRCKLIQCEPNRYRSFTEMKEILKSRFPFTSENAYLKLIKKLLSNNKSIILVYCTVIDKVVFKYVDNPSGQYISNYSAKNFYTTRGVDGLTLESINELLNNVK